MSEAIAALFMFSWRVFFETVFLWTGLRRASGISLGYHRLHTPQVLSAAAVA